MLFDSPWLRGGVNHRAFTTLVGAGASLRNALWGDHVDARQRFEEALARHVGVAHAVATASGRVALAAMVDALALPPGAPFLLPVNSYDGLLPVLLARGLDLRFVDVGPDHQMDPRAAERALRGVHGRGALLATHLWGLPCDVAALRALCESHGVSLLEDCAHTLATETGVGPAGSVGRAALLSFHPRKALNTLGGGALVTRDGELAEHVRGRLRAPRASRVRDLAQLAAHVAERDLIFGSRLYPLTRQVFEHEALFASARALYGGGQRRPSTRGGEQLSDMKALLGLAQLERMEERTARLDAIWSRFDEAVACAPGLAPPARYPDRGHGRYMYVLSTRDPAQLAHELWRRGIGSARGPSLVACLDPAGPGAYPGLQRLRATSLALPFADSLRDDDVERIATALVEASASIA